MLRRIFRFILFVSIGVGLLGAVVVGVAGTYFYIRFTRDLPQIESLKDYRPNAVTSIYSRDGVLIAEAFDSGNRRYPADFTEIPVLLRNAFLAAEDADFYRHPGIDPISIARALLKNLMKKKVRQGASTITQQTVKSLLLTREKSMERKVKEAILSYRLEHYLTKDEIFSIYLNEIFLGSGTSGVKAASRVHFHKEMNELSLGECAFLAGLPQRPSELTNPKNRKDAIERQHYVLNQMLRNNMITSAQYEQSMKEPLTIYKQDEQTIFAAPYFAGYIINDVLPEVLKKVDPYLTAGTPGGYRVYTSVDVGATELAVRSLQKGLREIDKRRGWRGPVKRVEEGEKVTQLGNELIFVKSDVHPDNVYRAVVEKIGPEAGALEVRVGALEGRLDLKKAGWAKRFLKDDQPLGIEPAKMLHVGDVIEVSLTPPPKPDKKDAKKDEKAADEKTEPSAADNSPLDLQLDQTPLLEGAFVLANSLSGEIRAMVGGYDYRRSQFNRVTQARRQPGSSFKPFVYLSAIESLNYTPTTIVPDEPISLPAGNGEMWTPGNFDHKFLGPITLRTALQRSRNVVSVYLIEKLGVDRVIQTAHRLGLTTDIPPNLSISLGTAEIEMLEMIRAYGAFSSGGLLADPLVIRQIKDRDGKVIYEQHPHARRVIDEDNAFLMANLMKGVVERGTATILRELERPMAGKTGTTNDQMDAWFLGYTPEWVAGVWTGFDQKKSIGKLETGGKAAAPVMLYFMKEFLKDTPPIDFTLTDGVIPAPIDLESGHPVSFDTPGAFVEYFKSGTEPHYISAADSTAEAGVEEQPDAASERPRNDYLSGQEF